MIRRVLQVLKMPFYAVRTGRNPGIYNDWDSCKAQVDKFPKARYKKFNTTQEAENFVNGDDGFSSTNSYSAPRFQESSSKYNPPSTSHVQPTYHKLGSNHISPLTHRNLKQQVDNLASLANDLSRQIESYERNHSQASKKTPSTTPSSQYTHNTGPSKRPYSTTSSSHTQNTVPAKRCKHNNSGKFRGSSFEESEAMTVYTDGACFGNGQNGATAGIGVYWGDGHPDNVCERLPGRQTNNRAEIHAAVKAIKQAKSKGVSNLILKTDSQFCINGITTWIHNWKRNGWKLSTGQPVVNKADFEELESSLHGINVQWVHVRGHRGEHGNEAADRLANEGAVKPKVR